MGQQESVRGSQVLLERLEGEGKTYSKETLGKIVHAVKQESVKVANWCQYGQPAVDGFCGTVHVRPEVAGSILGRLIELDPAVRLRFEVFPYGIPALDEVRIHFAAGRIGGR